MRARRLAELLCIACFALGGFISQSAGRNKELFYLGIILSAGSLIWYFKKGQWLKGWVGDSKEEMEQEYDSIEIALDKGGLSPKKLDKLIARQRDLRSAINEYAREHPGR